VPYRELRAYVEREMQAKRTEIERQRKIHRAPHGLPELDGRMFCSSMTHSGFSGADRIDRSFRRLGAGRIVLAVPSDSIQVGSDIGIAWMISSLRIQ